ncbi:MAG: hypothetical protein ABI645_08990 [Pseudomonadota bacterium]
MNGTLPQIYWYVFMAVAIGSTIAAITFGTVLEHRRRMRALDILKMYAEKGAEPPAAITQRLAEQILESENSPSTVRKRQGALIQGFLGLLYSGCAMGGIAWWLTAANGPEWAIIATYCGTAFFGLGAVGMLSAAIFSHDK